MHMYFRIHDKAVHHLLTAINVTGRPTFPSRLKPLSSCTWA